MNKRLYNAKLHRNDYQRLADAVAVCRSTMSPKAFQHIVDQLALALTDTNPRFDYDKWMDACFNPNAQQANLE